MMAEFVYNNKVFATTGISLFFALYDQYFRYLIQNFSDQTLTPTTLKE